MNRYPFWKYLILLFALTLGAIYSLPNIYPPDPAVQISGTSSSLEMTEADERRVGRALAAAGITAKAVEREENRILVRLADSAEQLPAKAFIESELGVGDYVVALNLADTTPGWLASLGASPMKLGLDLSGGVHFLMEVDTPKAVATRMASMLSDFKTELRAGDVRGIVRIEEGLIVGRFKTAELRDAASSIAFKELPEMQRRSRSQGDEYLLELTLSEAAIATIEDEAIEQNLITLRNRVNELGVSEPLVQRQGRSRIVVELPGVQDTTTAKRIIEKTANLEFRIEAQRDARNYEKEAYEYEGREVFLEREIIITGQSVSGARVGIDENSQPQVNIDLDATGGKKMNRKTRDAIKKRMAVIFIERKARQVGEEIGEDGQPVPIIERYDDRRIISLATIQSALSSQFRITGIGSSSEAAELALLLRAGALAAPMTFIEERTIGPSLGAENIALGVKSVIIGLAAVVVAMLVIYKVFGFAANLALAFNLVLIIAVMSMLGATLTLPGIAGIVLTVGMAVDANVLIFSRIREELRAGASPPLAIQTGYDRAFVTILDANLTTLLAAVILWSIGTGPIKGFAITLSIGILTSMFTAIMGTRAIVNLVYGGRSVKKILI